MNRTRRRITQKKTQKKQYGFVKVTGTIYDIFLLVMISDRAIKIEKHIHVCLIDNSKAFDEVSY